MASRTLCTLVFWISVGCTADTSDKPPPADGTGTTGLEPDLDGDGWTADVDCDDADPRVNPGAEERCDGIDNDCDGELDPSTSVDATTWFTDADADGWGDDANPQTACAAPAGTTDQGGDCDDADATRSPSATEVCGGIDEDCDGLLDDEDPSLDLSTAGTWYADSDADGYGDPHRATQACAAPADHLADRTDCDDTTADVHPDAQEVCDDLDNDCDGLVDDGDPSVDPLSSRPFYADADADGYGAGAVAFEACSGGEGFVPNDADCDDLDADISPAAREVCDPDDVDENCDGLADDDDATVDTATTVMWVPDADTDGFGDATDPGTPLCDAPTGTSTAWTTDTSDCDDSDASVHPDATEVCDADDVDEDCDGLADDDDSSVQPDTRTAWAPDADGDSFGSAVAVPTDACDDPSTSGSAFVADATDCDDADASIHPAATEVCDAADVDEDCDGLADDADPSVDRSAGSAVYPDADADGHGADGATAEVFCDPPPTGYAATDDDCDDTDARVNPSMPEVCSFADDDCDATTDQSGLVRFVDTAGTDTDLSATWAAGTGGAPVAWTSTSDGTLWVCTGTWTANLVVDGHTVDIVGPDGALSTSIDGDAHDSVLVVEPGSEVDLLGLTLENGDAALGGGISATGSILTVREAQVLDSSADDGGGIYVHTGTLTLTDSLVAFNTASGEGGGVYIDDALGAGHTITGVSLDTNDAGNHGGGLYLKGHPSVALDTVDITDNTATVDGGGLFQNDGTMVLIDTVFDGNGAGDDGGGLFGKDDATLTDCVLSANTSGDNGGGAYFDLSTSETVSIVATSPSAPSQLHGNSAGNRGDAIFVKLANKSPSPVLEVVSADFDLDTVRVDAASDQTLTPGNGASLECTYSDGCTTP